MNHGKNHLYIMGIGYLAILFISLWIGASAFLLFFFFCFFMMAVMMLSTGRDDRAKGDGKGGSHEH